MKQLIKLGKYILLFALIFTIPACSGSPINPDEIESSTEPEPEPSQTVPPETTEKPQMSEMSETSAPISETAEISAAIPETEPEIIPAVTTAAQTTPPQTVAATTTAATTQTTAAQTTALQTTAAVTTEPPPLSQVPLTRESYRISIRNNQFVVNGSVPIWINGTNTPWNNWNDFSGSNFDEKWWDNHFADLAANGVNASRIWINCNNNQGTGNNQGQRSIVTINENGMVTGVSAQHWQHLDKLFASAERHGIYIMATILSFDHFKHNDWSNNVPERWRKMVQSEAAINSFIEHYTLPFVNRYKDNPFLWSIDLMNEPDWVHEGGECGQLKWEDISHFFARNAAAIRENSKILVTVGMAFPKYNSDLSGYEGNKVSDAFLQSLYKNPNAKLDFWSPHYYDWVGQWYGVPFTSSPYGARSSGGWGLCPSKPAVIGECSVKGSAGFTLIQDYVNSFNNGWHGVMAWTSNGADENGGFADQITASRRIAELHPELVYPLR